MRSARATRLLVAIALSPAKVMRKTPPQVVACGFPVRAIGLAQTGNPFSAARLFRRAKAAVTL